MSLHRDPGIATSWPADIPSRFTLDAENAQAWRASLGPDVIMNSATFPIDEIASTATVLANVMDDPDSDGIFRRASLFRLFDDRLVPSPGFAAFGIGCGDTRKDSGGRAALSGKISEDGLDFRGKKIPIDRDAKLLLRFRGPNRDIRVVQRRGHYRIRAAAASGGKETIPNADSFKDAYVFFGFSAPGLLDLRPTPISRVCPGVEIHATMLDNLLTGDFLRDAPPPAVAFSTLLFSLLATIS